MNTHAWTHARTMRMFIHITIHRASTHSYMSHKAQTHTHTEMNWYAHTHIHGHRLTCTDKYTCVWYEFTHSHVDSTYYEPAAPLTSTYRVYPQQNHSIPMLSQMCSSVFNIWAYESWTIGEAQSANITQNSKMTWRIGRTHTPTHTHTVTDTLLVPVQRSTKPLTHSHQTYPSRRFFYIYCAKRHTHWEWMTECFKTHTYTHAQHTHTHTHTHIHTHMHTYIHTYTHTHTCMKHLPVGPQPIPKCWRKKRKLAWNALLVVLIIHSVHWMKWLLLYR